MIKKLLTLFVLTVTALGAAAQSEIAVGNPAPNFTLPDASGKAVSLNSLQGKWVVVDFWGSWCRWCIKGFPEMKESYSKLGDKVTFIGVACRDTKEQWLNALKQYELPWLNVWDDPDKPQVMQLYELRGFPTKIIIDPTGVIRNITLGEDPEFYDALNQLVN